MGVVDRVSSLFAIPRDDRWPPTVREVMQSHQERSIVFETNELPLSEQVARAQTRRANYNPWRKPTAGEALGVPAIFRSVALISNIGGAMTLRAFRNGRLLSDTQRPTLIKRPNPRGTPRNFFRDTIYSMAVYGEAWWWIAHRDSEGNPDALFLVPPREIQVTENPDNRLRPTIVWTTKSKNPIPNDELRQITLLQEPGSLRGFGPLQVCGAAVSVSVEAQEWAANFYAEGGQPSTIIRSANILGGDEDDDGSDEADRMRDQWVNRPNNVPRVIDPRIESVDYAQPNEQGAQMLEARAHQVGEAVRMYGVPESLLAHSTPGSSLTYTNVGQELDKLIKTVLKPDYLEAIEQEISDLLTRSTVARFNTDAFTMADIKTRWDVYKTAVDVIGQEEAASWARREQGFEPGDIENAPVPTAQTIPQVIPLAPRALPSDLRCPKCGKLQATNFSGSGRFKCYRCDHAWVAA